MDVSSSVRIESEVASNSRLTVEEAAVATRYLEQIFLGHDRSLFFQRCQERQPAISRRHFHPAAHRLSNERELRLGNGYGYLVCKRVHLEMVFLG